MEELSILPRKVLVQLQVLGCIQAGFPTSASEEMIDTMSLDEYLIENKEATYTLKVRSDAMVDAGILPGDMLIVERGRTPKRGDIVVVEVDGTYKMMHFPISQTEEMKIEAVVRSVIRKY